jgi:hypothetical protein
MDMTKKVLLLLTAGLIATTSCRQNAVLTVNVVNTLDVSRTEETVEVPWLLVEERFGPVDPLKVVVYNHQGMRQLSQVLYKGESAPQSLIFQADVPAQGNAIYLLKLGKLSVSLPEYKVLARLVPERMDDFAWENNRIAYRVYGPALQKVDGPSNGFDVWCKRTDHLIIDKWYDLDLSGKATYHHDNGEGLDCYKVGRTLGCGAMAPYINGSLVLGNNFTLSKILDNGPIRTSFELTYPPLEFKGRYAIEQRRISLDANKQLNRISEVFVGSDDITVAAGIALKNGGTVATTAAADPRHKPLLAPEKGYIMYSEKADKLPTDSIDNGVIFSAVVFPDGGMIDAKVENDHVLALGEYKAGEPFVYYSGAGWSKAGAGWGVNRYPTAKAWQDYIDLETVKLRNPLQLRYK